MKSKRLRKLTDKERRLALFVLNDLLYEDLPEEPTEYDVLMYQKVENSYQSSLRIIRLPPSKASCKCVKNTYTQ